MNALRNNLELNSQLGLLKREEIEEKLNKLTGTKISDIQKLANT